MHSITVYHGSQSIISSPQFGAGKPYNDYGLGFYCTESIELAKEWACSVRRDGYANKYILRLSGLKIVHLNEEPYTILNWMAILLKNRYFDIDNNIAYQAREYMLENFLPDISDADVIIGYRADDSYFSFARDFVNNTLSVRELNVAMRLGELGEQIVLVSPKAFDQIEFIGYEEAKHRTYYPKRELRDNAARDAYRNRKSSITDDIFMLDIMRGNIKNGDPRLQSELR